MARISPMGAMFLGVLVIGLLLVVAEGTLLDDDYPTSCPKKDPMDQVIMLPHESNCTLYYMCQRGKKILKSCPLADEDGERLFFNPDTHTCDWESNVDCEQPEPTLIGLRKILPVPTKCPKTDSKEQAVHLQHEDDCTKFYKCQFGKPILQDCPCLEDGTRLYFNKDEQVCDFSFNVDCESDPLKATPCPAQEDQLKLKLSALKKILPVPTKCPKRDSKLFTVHLAHENDCTKFYKCQYGKKRLENCPCDGDGTRLYFNKYEQVCDFSFNVDCESDPKLAKPCPGSDRTDRTPSTEITTPPTKTPPTKPPPPTTKPTIPRPVPGPLGCRTTCPNNDPPNRITPLPHNDCRKWCRCQNNQVTVHTCPNDFHFSPTLQYCTTPETAGCRPIDEPLMNILGYNDRFMW